jgi:hypothetical protein
MKPRYLLITIAAFFAARSITSAVTVHWGNSIFASMVKSDGTPITAADGFQFQLGVFESGFLPTTANTATWVANWRSLDSADYNAPARYFSSTFELRPAASGQTDGSGQPLAESNSPESSGYLVPQSSKVYLMVFNNTAMDTTTEMFLGSAESWLVGPADDSQTAKPVDYRVSGITQPIFGGANNTPGGGEKSPPTSYAIQTATFVPEPSSAFLFALAAGWFMRRRKV